VLWFVQASKERQLKSALAARSAAVSADPASVVAELRRVTRRGGVIGAASVEYGGIILGGAQTTDPQRFYDIRQQLWRAEGIAEPNMGRRLRGLFQEAEFGRMEALAHYISYGTSDRIVAFARDQAAECRDQRLQITIARHGITSAGRTQPPGGFVGRMGSRSGGLLCLPVV